MKRSASEPGVSDHLIQFFDLCVYELQSLDFPISQPQNMDAILSVQKIDRPKRPPVV